MDFKLSSFSYKSWKSNLIGLQLNFLNGYATPMFETDPGDDLQLSTVTVNVNPERDIRFISMKIFAFQYYGIAFYDSD